MINGKTLSVPLNILSSVIRPQATLNGCVYMLYSFLASRDFCCLLITFTNSLFWFFVPVNNFSVMSNWVLLGLTSTKQKIKCLAQGHNGEVLLYLQSSTLPLSHCAPQTVCTQIKTDILSADNLYKVWTQIRTNWMVVLIWIQTIWYSDSVPEWILLKLLILKSQQKTTKAWKITQQTKS